jgi:hypothetical protein
MLRPNQKPLLRKQFEECLVAQSGHRKAGSEKSDSMACKKKKEVISMEYDVMIKMIERTNDGYPQEPRK